MHLFVGIGAIVAAVVLIRIWTGAMNVRVVEEESLCSVEKRHPYLPKLGAILVSIVIAVGLFVLSLRFGKATSMASLTGSTATLRTIVVFVAISAFGLLDQFRWHGLRDRYKYFYAFVLGTLVTWILIAFKRAFFETGVGQDPFLMALGITCVVIGWRFLFGPWSASIKATVLGAFIFWVAYAILRFKTPQELLATAIASAIAFVPVVVWCMLFLRYHRERFSVVLLAFFAGILSTAPILFYSEIAERGLELNFFLFKVSPLNFGLSSKDFVAQSVFKNVTGSSSIVLSTIVTYLIVGVIEEVSKFWVLRHSSRDFFRSIDDVLQLAIIVAIGFAFAENILNPSYFVGFVRQYLLSPYGVHIGPFLSSVVGRSVLTMMVHILSTGVLGYYFGIAFFSSSIVRDHFAKGKYHPILQSLHQMLSLKTENIFARFCIVSGLFYSIVLHGLFDFVVSLPEVLPGHPSTVGQLIGSPAPSFLHTISITLLPSLLYIVGGFWLLVYLFEKKEDLKEYGHVVETQAIID